MKKILLSLLFIITFNLSYCDCAGGAIWVWPRSGEISPNPIFVIEGYYGSRDLIRQLGSKHNVYLISENDTVKCDISKRCEGQFLVNQAILVPTELLMLGHTYRLFIDKLSSLDSIEFSYVEEHFKWNVGYKSDRVSPKWKNPPKVFYKSYTPLGCGPSVNVTFCASIEDESPVLILARIKNLKNDSITEYFIESDSTTFSIGHGMCYGPFVFEDNSQYYGSFSLMDASGNVTFDSVVTVQFTSPSNRKGVQTDDSEICECGNIKITLNNPEPKNLKLFSIIASLGIFILAIWCMTKMNSWTSQDKT